MDKKIYETFKRSLTTISQSFIDDYIKQNAGFRALSGLKEKIVRSSNGKCCRWCTQMAGVYSYPAPNDIYRRHDNCDCTVTYISEKGGQDVYSKQQLRQEEVAERIKKAVELSEEEKEKTKITEWIREHTYEKKKIKYDDEFDKKKHQKEIRCAEWMSEIFGGDIKCLTERRSKPTPDYIWEGRAWEEKSVSSKTSADDQVRKGYEQITALEGVDAGGIVITIADPRQELNTLLEKAEKRLSDEIRRHGISGISLIIKRENQIIKIIEK